MKVVADIKTISAMVTSFVCPLVPELKNVLERLAPKNSAFCAAFNRSPLKNPCGTSRAIPFNTVNRAKNIGAWARIGKHDARGLVLCYL